MHISVPNFSIFSNLLINNYEYFYNNQWIWWAADALPAPLTSALLSPRPLLLAVISTTRGGGVVEAIPT